ncbi:MAG: DPP IV N-terminal domain-containing protein [Acidobacteriota bacterium]
MRISARYLTLTLLVASCTALLAQEKKPLSIEAIFGAELSSRGPSQTRWTPDGRLSYFESADGGRQLWIMDPSSGEKQLLADAEQLQRMAPSPTQATRDERERTRRTRFGVQAYIWSPDGGQILFASAGQLYLFDVESKQSRLLATEKKGVLDPKFSPHGKWISFVHQHDIWLVSVADGDEKQITFGGRDTVLHGDLDWVYPEEFGVRSGYHWSPQGGHIAFLEMDETLVPTYPITEQVSIQASADFQRYPKPGDPNPRVRVGIVDVRTGHTAWIDRAAEYIPRIDWADEQTLAVQLLDRRQHNLEIIFVDPRSGRSQTVLTEQDEHWISVTNDLTFLDNGRQFLWTSERSGLSHIYLYGRDGALVRQLTKGEFEVNSISGLDEDGGWVYYTSNESNPIGNSLYRVRLDGSGKEELSRRKGSHGINMNPPATAYRDRYSSLTDMGDTTVRFIASNRSTLFHKPKSLDEYDLVQPEHHEMRTSDNDLIRLLIYKPRRLEEGRRHPVLVYVYGMAGVPTIRDSWGRGRDLFHQFLVQQGYIVAHIDDRSSAMRGHKYAVLADHNLGPLAAQDHEVGVNFLKSLPYVDPERMAVWGWSGGGFTTCFHMTHTKLFKAGIAGAPVTDWRLYDSIYTERYMGLPGEDIEAYERTSSVEAAANLNGRLLLIHGTHDDNVHPQNTIQLMNGLIKNRKQFEVMFYPNKTHGISGRDEKVHLYTMIYEFLERQLGPSGSAYQTVSGSR